MTSSQPSSATAFHRSGAVARMLRMPVATLRVWERRYGLTQPKLSPSGQRLYSAEDVRRLAVVRQLTELGHAIGSLASLDMPQLQRVAATQAHASAAARTAGSTRTPPTTVRRVRPVRALPPSIQPRHIRPHAGLAAGRDRHRPGARLKRPALVRRLGGAVVLLGPFDDVAQAASALRRSDVDALLIHEPTVQAGWMAALDAAAPALVGVPKAVLYGFAADAVCESLANAGTALLREPQPDAVVAQWLHVLSLAATAPPPGAPQVTPLPETAPRRWDDAALADFAGRSSTMACECPRHVAELLVQLSHFEGYSAECEQRSAADAELHAHLRHVAAASRALFEAALEHVALHEGMMLPAQARHEG